MKWSDHLLQMTFQVTSTCFKNNDTMPKKQTYNGFGVGGDNLSPQLSWTNQPSDTKSFAIVCHDPDAPKTHGWYHWFLINIPKDVTEIAEGGKIPGTKELNTDFKSAGYGGAAPPKGHGKHHYNFTVYALNVESLKISASEPHQIEKEIKKHAIGSASITALYER